MHFADSPRWATVAASHFRFPTLLTAKELYHARQQLSKIPFFEPMSKRRRGFPSETKVKRGVRIVHGDKLLEEKLGRNDPCPCGSGQTIQTMLPPIRAAFDGANRDEYF